MIRIILGSMFGVTLLLALELRLSEQNATAGEKFVIHLIAQGKQIEFELPEKIAEYEVLSVKRANNTVIVNNDVSYEKRVSLTIQPEANFIIPSISAIVDGELQRSKPRPVAVVKPAQNLDEAYYISMSADKTEAYLNEAVTVTIRLKERADKRLLDVVYTPPSKEGFWVKQIQEDKPRQAGEFILHEMRYRYYPQREGNLTIEPPKAKIGVPKKTTDIFGTTYVPEYRTIAAKPLQIAVKAPPEAIKMVGEFTLESRVSSVETKANKPVHLFITLKGSGNFDDFEGFALELPSVVTYESEPKIEKGVYTKKFSLVSDQNFTVPALHFHYFDTKEQRIRTLKTPRYKIKVDSSINRTDPLPAAAPTASGSVEQKSGSYLDLGYALLIFAAGIAVGYLAAKARKGTAYKKERSAHTELQRLLPHADDPEVLELLYELYKKERGEKGIKIDKKRLREMLKRYDV